MLNQSQRSVTADPSCSTDSLRRRCRPFKGLKINAKGRQIFAQPMKLIASLQRLSEVLSQIFADVVITFGVSALLPVNNQHEEQGYMLLRCDKAMEKIN